MGGVSLSLAEETEETTVQIKITVEAEDGKEIYDGNFSGEEFDSSSYAFSLEDKTEEEQQKIANDAAVITLEGDLSDLNYVVVSTNSDAEPVEVNITGNTTEIIAADESSVKVVGNVKTDDTGITAYDKSKVTVIGDITAGTYEQIEYEGGYVDERIYGQGISAHGSSNVTVEKGNITSEASGIYTDGGSTAIVTVTGDVKSNHDAGIETSMYAGYDEEKYQPVFEDNKSEITVNGNVTGDTYGIITSGSAKVTVNEGDVSKIGTDNRYGSGAAISAQNMYTWDQEKNDTVIYENKSVVYVDGNVISNTNGISAGGSSEVTVTENVEVTTEETTDDTGYYRSYASGVQASDSSNVYVEGSVIVNNDMYGTGVSVSGDAVATIDKDVTIASGSAVSADKAYDYIKGEELESAGTVIIGGNVTSNNGQAVIMDGNANVTIGGDVTGNMFTFKANEDEDDEEEPEEEDEEELTNFEKAFNEAKEKAFENFEYEDFKNGVVQVNLNEEGNDGQLIVKGTISASDEDSIPLTLRYFVDEDDKVAKLPDLPDIKVYEIVPTDGEYFDVNVRLTKELDFTFVDEYSGDTIPVGEYVALSEEDHEAVIEAIAKAIQYIIKLDDNAVGKVSIDSKFYDAENDLYVAHENEAVSLTLSGVDNITATGNYTLIRNADGTWTLTIQRGGGVTISVVIPAAVAASIQETTTPGRHVPIGSTLTFGRYDLNGDGTAEDLTWRILSAQNGQVRLALVDGLEATPDDFSNSFNEEETAAIVGGISELSEKEVKRYFRDGMVHPSINVKLSALDLNY